MNIKIIDSVTVMAEYISRFDTQLVIVHETIVSLILILAALFGFLAGYMADLFDKSKCIIIEALIFGFGAALKEGAVTLVMFVIKRYIEGFGEGLYLNILIM